MNLMSDLCMMIVLRGSSLERVSKCQGNQDFIITMVINRMNRDYCLVERTSLEEVKGTCKDDKNALVRVGLPKSLLHRVLF